MFENIISGFYEFFNFNSFLYMNIGLFLGVIFGAIPGLSVMLCLVLFLPFTYSIGPIESFMFLLGIYCAGSYGGSISAILIRTPGTPHAAATMIDGHPLAEKGEAKKALKIALEASTFGGIFSALILLFTAPQVAKIAAKFGAPEYFILCVFGLSVIAGVSGDSLLKGILSGCLGLFISTIGMDIISGTFRFTLNNYNLYAGLPLVVVLIGLFAISETLLKANMKIGIEKETEKDHLGSGKITKFEYERIFSPTLKSSIIGVIIGAIPGTGASMASFLSYDRAKKSSKFPNEFGNGSIEGVAAAEAANNAVTGATLIPLLTLGIPGDGAVAILLGTLMVNGLTPGPNLFKEHGVTLYAIMVGLIFINLFMFFQGRFLTKYFAKVTEIPKEILVPLIVIFCFAGIYSVNSSIFDLKCSIIFGVIAYILIKLKFSTIPILLGMVLGNLTEMNFRRSLIISQGNLSIFIKRPISLFFILLLILAIFFIIRSSKKAN
ncbi:tripartite tricarboxylate transporter permease [uncultured Cetobacterium sp.]|uniref:tripartite tricarboxylate transporter permease n=1 Tax=uncultured Cetobacterium sp. TaxID=527638 RepID=UPI00260FB904|nr:tripartite tricarboxylate transporter permease [uncultured Cetobacterium sp.]